MDLNTVAEVVSPAGPGQWRPGDAWLGGGTALFGASDPAVTRLLDLNAAGWPALTVHPGGLEIAATCTIAELAAFEPPAQWKALAGLKRPCCDAFLASFKIWNVATVGGNLCAALPAGPMITLGAALDGRCRILGPDGSERWVPVAGFVTGDGTTALRPGELLRSVHLSTPALTGLTAYRRGSLHRHGRSAVLLTGRLDHNAGLDQNAGPDHNPGPNHNPGPDHGGGLVLTVTAATKRPYQLRFASMPAAETVSIALAERIPPDAYVSDVHGSPAWRRHLTRMYAEQIRAELAG